MYAFEHDHIQLENKYNKKHPEQDNTRNRSSMKMRMEKQGKTQ